MANLKDISRQIKSVKNTQKTTKAMKLVSSAKLKKAQKLSQQSKSYANKIADVLSQIATKISMVQNDDNQHKALVSNNKPNIVDIVFVTADKGLCGGFNITTIKKVRELKETYIKNGSKVRLRAIGRKGVDFFKFAGVELLQQEIGLSANPTYEKAVKFIKKVFDDFQDAKCDKVVVVHNGFLNMLSQELKTAELLPISVDTNKATHTQSMLDIEPDDDKEVLEELIGKYIEFSLYYSLIDSLAAEHSARMQAMENATNNATDRVNDLTVQFNKARQAAITTELIEIISGVEAQK
jgi:F-type H+-transporting ATPase subunit gamma